MSVRSHQSAPGPIGRVEMWRDGSRFGLSVAAPFVWRCPSTLTVAPFPHPAHRTGHAERPHPALGQDFTPSHTPGCASARSRAYETVVPVEVLEWIGPAPASPDLVCRVGFAPTGKAPPYHGARQKRSLTPVRQLLPRGSS